MFAILTAAAGLVLTSPDKSIELTLSADGAHYSVSRKGEEIVTSSPLGVVLAQAEPYGPMAEIRVKKARHSGKIALVATKSASAADSYNGMSVTYGETSGAHRRMVIEARAYNDGIAFRYRLPAGSAYLVKGEATGFQFPGDAECEVSEYVGSHEMPSSRVRISQLQSGKLYDVPAVCASASGQTHFAIAQSSLPGYAGSSLEPAGNGFRVRVTPLPGKPDVAVEAADGLTSAWRVIMMGDRAGDLIPSPLIGNLAPQAQGDFSWVKPGKVAWDWWSGPTAGVKPSMAFYERFIDFAAASGFPYFLMDAGWAYGSTPCCNPDPGTDITRADPAIDMPALVKYAADRHVGLLLWAHWRHVEQRVDQVLDTYQRWGIKGIKVDFMERDDQDMVNFYHRLAEGTAKRHLLLDMHGAYPPAGLERTYPNFITQEGVMGAEWNKFSKRVTPGHNVRLAYTRMLLGPMDYTPGGFHNATPDTFVVRDIMPMTQSTRGQALAMYVVYDSPLQMVSDDPAAYAGQPGFDFVKMVPTAWDETRFVGGTPETYVALARRKGKVWYVGAMTNEEGRTIDIPLNFLGKGAWSARMWADGADANSLTQDERGVTAKDSVSLAMKGAGGGVIVLTPEK
ncbi:MAG: glycoside hydrolase family 97 protein [Asticcacaulis sp.]